jgi:HEPN domain-containing protein
MDPTDVNIPRLWVERAQYDLGTARAMLESARYLYVLFCCQQAIEKTLKAIIAKRTGECPPRLHNLPALSERAGIQLDQDRLRLIEDLSRYYIQSRYAEEIPDLSTTLNRSIADAVLKQTEDLFKWLSSML